MACELGTRGIRVNTFSAGHIANGIVANTMNGKNLADEWANRNTLGRLARLDEMRGVTVWLASDASSFCTGSEYVLSSFSWDLMLTRSSVLLQHRSQWWLHQLVREKGGKGCIYRFLALDIIRTKYHEYYDLHACSYTLHTFAPKSKAATADFSREYHISVRLCKGVLYMP